MLQRATLLELRKKRRDETTTSSSSTSNNSELSEWRIKRREEKSSDPETDQESDQETQVDSEVICLSISDYLTEDDQSRLKRIARAEALAKIRKLRLSLTDADLLVSSAQESQNSSREKKLAKLQECLSIKGYEQIMPGTPYVTRIARTDEELHQAVQILQNALAHERMLYAHDNYVMYHATTTYPYSYLETQLALLDQELSGTATIINSETLVLRQPNARIRHRYITDKSSRSSSLTREQYIAHGVGAERDWAHTHALLSCSPALTSALSVGRGESALTYWATKGNMSEVHLDIDAILQRYPNLAQYAVRYMHEMQEAIENYISNSNSSTLLQLVLPQAILDKYTYLSRAYGVKLKPISIREGMHTVSPRDILDALRSDPLAYQAVNLDELQLRLCLVDSSLYNYLRVYAYNTNQKLLDEYHAYIKLIVDKIKKEISGSTY